MCLLFHIVFPVIYESEKTTEKNLHIYIYIYIYIYKLTDCSWQQPEGFFFQYLQHQGVQKDTTFSGLLHLLLIGTL